MLLKRLQMIKTQGYLTIHPRKQLHSVTSDVICSYCSERNPLKRAILSKKKFNAIYVSGFVIVGETYIRWNA